MFTTISSWGGISRFGQVLQQFLYLFPDGEQEQNLRLNLDYYSAGTTTMSELLDAQTLYQQSRDKYVEAYTNYELKKREYLQATGR